MQALQLWGGVECTVLRVGGEWRDQMAETGHRDRDSDLDLIASLGIRKLRYPVLWEHVAPEDPARCDWTWSDRRLTRLRELRIAPIVGLIHHGCGPAYTDLLDPLFPHKLADYAAHVAARYPWVRDWTPVNEPLTTARFSSLYGHWHPHRRDGHSFLTALVNECRGIAQAMRAIREIQPQARLIQTEDLGRVFSTPVLAGQAAHENERRWLSFDLLCGRLGRDHPWYAIFVAEGVPEEHLRELVENPCVPDMLGINHYVTSDRFLDHRVDLYRPETIGGNAERRYADVEAVRVPLSLQQVGPLARLREAWARYRLPMAVTEAHLGCTEPEECARWLIEIWNAAGQLQREGADIHAVTIWSLFGAVDWSSLLRRRDGDYEPGVFDIRYDPPRPTPLAKAARALATTGRFADPMVKDPGWWRRSDRLVVPEQGWAAG